MLDCVHADKHSQDICPSVEGRRHLQVDDLAGAEADPPAPGNVAFGTREDSVFAEEYTVR